MSTQTHHTGQTVPHDKQTGTSVEDIPCEPWELILPIEGTQIASGVATVEFHDKLYVFFIKEKQPDVLSLGYLVMIKNAHSKLVVESRHELTVAAVGRFRPAVTVYDNYLFCFYTGTDQRIRYLAYSGVQWSPTILVPHLLTADAPAVVSHEQALYLALQGTVEGQFFHKVFENFTWGKNIQSPTLRITGSPALCLFNDKPTAAIEGLDGLLHIFEFSDNTWQRTYKSSLPGTFGSPALNVWNGLLIYGLQKHVSKRYVTEAVHSAGTSPYYSKTIGAYLSPPCLSVYKGDFYLIGQRPCNDIGVSLFNPECL